MQCIAKAENGFTHFKERKQISLQPILCLNDFAVIRGKSKKYLLFFKMNSIDFGFVLKGERVVFKEIATLP